MTAPAVRGNAQNVLDSIGPGTLFVAAIDFDLLDTKVEVDAFVANPDAAVVGLRKIGYTEAGFEFTSSTTSEAIEVAEEVDELGSIVTKRVNGAKFTMAQPTLVNLNLALGGGDTTAAAPADGYEPPAAGGIVAVQLYHLTESGALWRFYRGTPEGDLTMAAGKAPAKRMIPVTFKLGLGGPNNKPWKVYPNADGLV